MQTLLHKAEHHKQHHHAQQNDLVLSENYFRVVGLVLMILGMTVAMVLLDIEFLSLFS